MADELTQHWRLAFDNKFLGAWNLWKGDRYLTATVTIERVAHETVTMQGGRKEPGTLIYFKGKRVPMILTKTMGKVLQSMHGPVPKGWEGKSITLYVERGFKTRDGLADVLRIRNDRAGQGLKDKLRGAPDDGPPEPPEQFGDDDNDPDKGP